MNTVIQVALIILAVVLVWKAFTFLAKNFKILAIGFALLFGAYYVYTNYVHFTAFKDVGKVVIHESGDAAKVVVKAVK